MAGRNVPVVLVPRYTGYVGDGQYYSQFIPVSAYSRITIDFWHGVLIGTGPPTVAINFRESNSLSGGQDCGGGPWVVPAAPGESTYRADLTMAWFQFGVILGGTNAGVTCWAQGFFELREK